ncbi:PREDICTED: aquaporin AQPcic-like [Dinoponera quadriceps]|uniref:Aquaporin AQPcic-like n=1 Tax=Dinoponera quadriceps TaxID=609295 RepID=A0A6P3X7M8_DINQU|nr:PREDICTED: aquaporin AQPcic-like [Dinoponera quadriceps]
MPADFRAGFKKWMQGEGTMKRNLLCGLAELIGTALLVFLGCMGCVGSLGVAPPHVQISLTFGFVVSIVVQCIGHISQAHINPAVTMGAVVLGKKSILEALIYIVSQIIGGILGFGILKVVTPTEKLTAGTVEQADMFCVTDVHGSMSAIQGFLLEAIATGVLMLLVCSVWDVRNEKNTDSVPLKFGLTVAVLAMAVGPYTGCSINPARSFAPALWNNQWARHWIYWFGPIAGSLFSAFMYKTVFGVPDKVEEEPVPEAVALNSLESQKPEQS